MRGPKVGTGTSSGQGGRGCGRLGAIHPGYGAAPARGKPTLLSRTGRGPTLNGAPRSDTKM
jgi:hypothetical protein